MLEIILLIVISLATGQCELPGKPSIAWSEGFYSIIDVDHTATSYKYLSKPKEAANVSVSWDVWSGSTPDYAEVLLNGSKVWSGPSGKKGSAEFQINHGGCYNLNIKSCNTEGCNVSDAKEIIVADTDGSHLSPLEYKHHKSYKIYKNTSGKLVAVYYPEWAVYTQNFPVNSIPFLNVNYILYSFLAICGGNGTNDALKEIKGSFEALQRSCHGLDDFKVTIHDPWAALQKSNEGLSQWNEPYKGNYGQLMRIKQAKPDIKILASIGGWTLSDPFFFMDDIINRRTFVDSVREFILTWKFFDGIDIDWEFPGGQGANLNLGSSKDGVTYSLLMKELREMLTKLTSKTGKRYKLTSAISPGGDKPKIVNFKSVQKYMDYFFLMSYDFKGAWSSEVLGHHTALFPPLWKPDEKNTADELVRYLISEGVESKKIVLGVAMYGRGWTGVHGYSNDIPFTGTATGPLKSLGENGTINYKDIVSDITKDKWKYTYDDIAKAAYLFNSSTGDLITFDNKKSVLEKGAYVKKHKLAGLFAWDISGDNGDILNAMNTGLGNSEL